MIPLGLPAWASAHLGARASDLLDGRLTPAEESQARAHLAACGECAQQLRAHRVLRSALRGLDVPGAPPDLVAGLLAVPAGPVPRPERAARPAPRSRVGAAVLGTMALASTGALGIGAVAGLDPQTRPRPAVVSGAGASAGVRPPGAQAAAVSLGGAQVVGLRPAGLQPAGSAVPSVVVAPAVAGTR